MYFIEGEAGYWTQVPPGRRHNQVNAANLGLRLNAFAMGDPDDPAVPLVSMLYIPAGATLPRHSHPCHRVEVMVRGSLQVSDRVLRPGDISISGPEEAYGPHVAGADGSLSVEIFSRSDGMDSGLGLTQDRPQASR